ncbi:hypothetical protein DITRI_Ditri02bG0194400 [Diplodiscus trichospermus]
MASDTADSHRRKHRCPPSDDEETEKSSKRHKHRHQKHRHHRHRSKKHEDKAEDGGEDSPHAPPPSVPRSDDDIEEGEILDEEPAFEIKAVESRERLGVSNPGPGEETNSVDEGDNGGKRNQSHAGLSRNISVESQGELVSRVVLDGHINGDFAFTHHVEDARQRQQPRSPSRSGKKKNYHDDVEEADAGKLSDMRKSMSCESSGEKYKTSANSPFDSRYDDYTRSRSESCDLARERSHSRSIINEEAVWKISHRNERDPSWDERHSNRNLVRSDDREQSVNYGRYAREEKYQSMETWGSERSREREIDWEHRRDKECERSRERKMDVEWRRDRDKDKDNERVRSRDRDMSDERRRDKERARNRDRDMIDERRREKEQERRREGELERRREKERGKSRDWDLDSERRREVCDRSWEREVDRDRKREKERGWSRDHSRTDDRDRERKKEKTEEWIQQQERERTDRSRDKGRNIEIENDGYGDRDRYKNYKHSERDETENYRDRTRKNERVKVHGSNSNSLEGDGDKLKRDEEEQYDFDESNTLKPAEQEEEELNRIKEESRKRRQAILEKHKGRQLQQQSQSHPVDVNKDNEPLENHGQTVAATDSRPDVLDGGREGVYVAEPLLSVGKSPSENGHAAAERTSGTPKSERSDDIFCDDIFGETPTGVCKSGQGGGLPVIRSGLHDNWDDAEGYYSYRFGELLDSRYEVTAAHGKGVFSTVVRAKDLKAGSNAPEEVAIKIIRNNETMHKACQLEVQILKELAGADPDDKRHCVRFVSSFKYRNHLCLVFESLHMNLREVLKKFGRNIGLKLTAVRAYAKQLFIALKHLKNCGVLHCDIKPDNVLVNEAKNVLKLCDFGSAMFAGRNEITPYLVSRFYRAPEIILGLPYDHPMDMWSVGCCLYELYTGKVLFPGPTNNDMLRLHMELKGLFPKKMLRKGAFTEQHFNQDLTFHATEEDPVNRKSIKRMIPNMKPKDISSIIVGSPGEDPKMVANFKDLLDKIFVLDPEKRMTVTQALAHPFITGK